MAEDRPLRILVVDDTVIFRKAVSDILAELSGVEVVGIAHNGKIAISKISSLKPDLITLFISLQGGASNLEDERTSAETFDPVDNAVF